MRHTESVRPSSRESGFALIMSLLALLLLSFLGLTLALTTSTEGQIASNYTNARAAYFNALAGAEVAKSILGANMDWNVILPKQRRSLSEMDANPATLGL